MLLSVIFSFVAWWRCMWRCRYGLCQSVLLWRASTAHR